MDPTLIGHVLLGLALGLAPAPAKPVRNPDPPAATLPLVFEANQGQAAPSVRFVAHRPGHDLLLGPGGVTLALDGAEGPRALTIAFEGARTDARIEGEGALRGRANYLIGTDPRGWHTDIPLYQRVAYRELYPAVDLVVGPGGDELLEYDFHVAPGGDPSPLGLRVSGARSLSLDGDGALRIDTVGGVLAQRAPIAYQDGPDGRQPVPARFVLRGADLVGFAIGDYDRSRPLVIDPPLAYATYLGGDGTDHVNAIAVDGDGKVYVTGATTSLAGPLATDFPIKGPIAGGEQLDGYSLPPPDPRPYPSQRKFDAFVGKLDTTQSGADSLVYLTFLGGDLGDDRAFALAVDSAGRAHVGGLTSSSDFPLVNPLQTCRDGSNTFVCDLNGSFLARLSASGNTLQYGSYLAGHDVDEVIALAVGPGGRLYVGGRSASLAGPSLPVAPGTANYHFYFPITATAAQPVNHGIFDAFLTVLDPDAATAAQQLVYSTFLGGCADDATLDLAVDAAGRAYLHGATQNPCTSLTTRLPIKNAIQPTYAGGLVDAFVAAIDPAVAGEPGLVFSTFLGGKYDENDLKRAGLALDGAGHVFVAGTTSSYDFPTTAGAAQRCGGMLPGNAANYPCNPATGQYSGALPPNGAIIDGYLTVFTPTGELLSSTYVGGIGQDSVSDLAVRPAGDVAYLTGSTTSTGLGSTCAAQPQLSLGRDAYLASVRLTDTWASALAHYTYLGGGSDDFGNGVAYDAGSASAFVGGYLTYNASTKPFPVTANALQATQPGASLQTFDNGFLVQVAKPQACAPDLVVRKLADADPLALGCGPLTYTIEVANLGVLTATQVTVTDPLPAPATVASVTSTQGTCAGTTTITCALGNLAPGEHATITIVVDVDPSYAPTQPPLVNTATATSFEADADPSDNAASVITHVAPAGDADGDGALDCVDACPDDPAKAQPGLCGCGAEDVPAALLSAPVVTEGDDGTVTAWFELTLAHPTCVDLAFAFATAPGADTATAATPDVDYLDTAGSLAIASGDVSALVPVTIAGDTLVEPDEHVALTVTPDLGGPALSAEATITDDDPPPVVSLVGPAIVAEGSTASYSFTVTASGPFTVAGASCGVNGVIGLVDTTIDAGGGGTGSITCVFPDGPAGSDVTVQVESGGATSDVVALAVLVTDVAPSVSLSGPSALPEGSVATYSFVVGDPGSDTFTVDGLPGCGAGGALVPGSIVLDPAGAGGSFDCLFADGDAGPLVTIAVIDSDGAASAIAGLAVAVANVAPTVALTGATAANEGDVLTYQLAIHDPGDEPVTLAGASCGDAGVLVPGSLVVTPDAGPGGLQASGSFACAFAAGPATSTVTATAEDPAGPGPTALLQVVIDDVAPVVVLAGPPALDEGTTGTWTFTVDAGSDTFTVGAGFPDCGADGTLDPASVTTDATGGSFACHFANGPIAATVRVQVVDGDGKGSNVATAAVAIANLAPSVTLTGPAQVASGATATYQLTVTDAGGDPFAASSGFPDCGAAGTLVPGSLVLGAAGGSFACTFAAGPAASQVAIQVTDADGADSAPATLQVSIDAPTAVSGTLGGQGKVPDGAAVAHVVASLTCDLAGGGKNLHLSSGPHKLKLDQVTSVACTDQPGVDPGLPVMGFDTLTGTGVGRYDGVPGHLVSFVLVDAGEPGVADRVTITIATAQGVTVKTIDALLVQGNLDAQP